MSALSNALRIAPVTIVLACAPGPIAWHDSFEESGIASRRPMQVRERDEVHRDGSGLRAPVFANQCPTSVRFWRDDALSYAAWWSLRADSSADIVASSTADGRTWTVPVRVDTAEVAKVGCNRPPPAIMGAGDNLHIVYSMRAREGPGVFLSHSMDRGRTFHSPVAVVYGERLGLSSVAASGNFVIVAYEDPNTTPTRISIAVSTTMAHLFEYREVVSSEDMAASHPRVHTDGKLVVLSWRRVADTTRQITRRGVIR